MPETSDRRVLLVAGHATGGIGGHVASLARGLPSRGWTPTVLTSRLTAGRFDLGPRVATLWPDRRSPGDVVRLRGLVAAATVVHAHGHQAGLLATAVAGSLPRGRRPPVIVSWHNAVLPQTRLRSAPAALWAQRWQARHADLVTGASSDLVQTAERIGARAAILAPVAAPPFRPGTRSIRADGRRVVLTVSRLALQKNLDMLVTAAARVVESVPDVVFLVAGDGDPGIRALLLEAIGHHGAPVELLGARDDVPDLLASADAFALPSLWEARSLAVQEAMAAGLPIVATDGGGLPDLLGLDGEAGVLVPFNDPGRLAVALVRILRDPDFAAGLGRAARRRYELLPTESDTLDEWSETYRRLVDR